MQISLSEPKHFKYVDIHPIENRIRLLVPFVAGTEVSTDNTCKSDIELRAFFTGGAVNELQSYKRILQFHLHLLDEGDLHYQRKKHYIEHINTYLRALDGVGHHYQTWVKSFLSRPSNLYSIQLRPRVVDPASQVFNPVFSVDRHNDILGKPLSSLYLDIHAIFPSLVVGKLTPRQQFVNQVLSVLPEKPCFADIQNALKSQCLELLEMNVDFDTWILSSPGQSSIKMNIQKELIDSFMGFDANVSSKDYINALLGICAPNLWRTMSGSPFYLEEFDNISHQTESLSLITQFFLGVLNVYCRAKQISHKNFGVILDKSLDLSHALVELVADRLRNGDDVEHAIIDFLNIHRGHDAFDLLRTLSTTGPDNDKNAIIQKFECAYRTVTATTENPHMDDFMLLDAEAEGEMHVFINHKGLICTDILNLLPQISLKQVTIPHQSEIVIDREPTVLIQKLIDVQWKDIPQTVLDVCCAHPVFQVPMLLNHVAKGEQELAHILLTGAEDQQYLLRTAGQMIDYSERIFHCTVYEYAYWAKDRHMLRMLESHMDNETKTLMLEKIDEIENFGLAYQQHGDDFQNTHYNMSFVLKNLSVEEFLKLKALLGQDFEKIQRAQLDNYQRLSFSSVEYEALKKRLDELTPKGIFYFFYCSPAAILSEKLQFDFLSLITALEHYVKYFHRWSLRQAVDAWLKVGQAQREVPAYIAQEYCRPDRAFDPLPTFEEETLPRISNGWFSLERLGYDFAFMRGGNEGPEPRYVVEGLLGSLWSFAIGTVPRAYCDLHAIRYLDEVSTAELTTVFHRLRSSVGQGLRV